MKYLKIVLAIAALIAGLWFINSSRAQAREAQQRASLQQPFSKAASFAAGPLWQPTAWDSEADAPAAVGEEPVIRATRRISIPFGFDTPLPVLAGGRDVIASGHGGCTADQQVTVAVTLTQSTSGAVATGEWMNSCSGELQTWSLRVTAHTTSSFATAAAEACGLATAREGAYVTDTFDWCKDVDLIRLDQRAYVPLILVP